jgi:hypothetical protein
MPSYATRNTSSSPLQALLNLVRFLQLLSIHQIALMMTASKISMAEAPTQRAELSTHLLNLLSQFFHLNKNSRRPKISEIRMHQTVFRSEAERALTFHYALLHPENLQRPMNLLK